MKTLLVAVLLMFVTFELKAQSVPGNATPVTSPDTSPEIATPVINTGAALAQSVAESLRMFKSKPQFMSWAVLQVKRVELEMVPDGAANGRGFGWGSTYNNQIPDIEEMADIVASFNIEFQLARRVWIKAHVKYADANFNSLFEGEQTFWPNYAKGGGMVIPEWVSPQVSIAKKIRIRLAGVRSLFVTLRDQYGNKTAEYQIDPDYEGYFNLPRQMIENDGEVVAYASDDTIQRPVVVAIRTGDYLVWERLLGTIRPTVKSIESLFDPVKIEILPFSRYDQGEDLLKSVTFTEEGLVQVLARTSEGEYAQSIVVINLQTSQMQHYTQVHGEFVDIPHGAGKYHIFASWKEFSDNTFAYDSYDEGNYGGGKGGGTAGGGGNF